MPVPEPIAAEQTVADPVASEWTADGVRGTCFRPEDVGETPVLVVPSMLEGPGPALSLARELAGRGRVACMVDPLGSNGVTQADIDVVDAMQGGSGEGGVMGAMPDSSLDSFTRINAAIEKAPGTMYRAMTLLDRRQGLVVVALGDDAYWATTRRTNGEKLLVLIPGGEDPGHPSRLAQGLPDVLLVGDHTEKWASYLDGHATVTTMPSADDAKLADAIVSFQTSAGPKTSSGCGCSSSPDAGTPMVALAGLLGLRRRNRTAPNEA